MKTPLRQAPRPCPICDATDQLSVEPTGGPRQFAFSAICDGCYDGAPQHSLSDDPSPQPMGEGETEEQAIASWHESANHYDRSDTETGGWACQHCGRGVVENHVCPQCGEVS